MEYTHIRVNVENRVTHLQLDRGRSNAFHADMLEEMKAAVQAAEADPGVEGLVLHGKEGFFSAGLDLITLYDYNEAEIRAFWELFMAFVESLVAFRKPAVAAISGHAPAGGCVLALCCDARVMAEGDYIIGLNEVPVGIVVPDSIFALYSFWLGQGTAYRYLLQGKLLSPREALASGLVDEVVAAQRIRTVAERHLGLYTQFERNTWWQSKANLRRELVQRMAANREESIALVLKQWWTPSTRSILKTIIENLTQKK